MSPTERARSRPDGLQIVLGMVALVALVLVGVFAIAVRDTTTELKVGEPAPAFELSTFDGRRITLESLRGQTVVLNFWASWCAECHVEAADLEALWRDYRDRGVIVLGVDYTDTEPAALAYLEQHGITYPNGPDLASRISEDYQLTGVPETVVIGPDGRIVPLDVRGFERPQAKLVGPVVPDGPFTPVDLRVLIDELLASTESSRTHRTLAALPSLAGRSLR